MDQETAQPVPSVQKLVDDRQERSDTYSESHEQDSDSSDLSAYEADNDAAENPQDDGMSISGGTDSSESLSAPDHDTPADVLQQPWAASTSGVANGLRTSTMALQEGPKKGRTKEYRKPQLIWHHPLPRGKRPLTDTDRLKLSVTNQSTNPLVQQVLLQPVCSFPSSLVSTLITSLHSHTQAMQSSSAVKALDKQARESSFNWIGRAVCGLLTSQGLKERIVRWAELQGAGPSEIREVKRRLKMGTGYRLGDLLTKEGIRGEIERAGKRGLGNLEYSIGVGEVGPASESAKEGKQVANESLCCKCGDVITVQPGEIAATKNYASKDLDAEIYLGKRELSNNHLHAHSLDSQVMVKASSKSVTKYPNLEVSDNHLIQLPVQPKLEKPALNAQLNKDPDPVDEQEDLLPEELQKLHEKVDWDEFEPIGPADEVLTSLRFDSISPKGQIFGLNSGGIDEPELNRILNLSNPTTTLSEAELPTESQALAHEVPQNATSDDTTIVENSSGLISKIEPEIVAEESKVTEIRTVAQPIRFSPEKEIVHSVSPVSKISSSHESEEIEEKQHQSEPIHQQATDEADVEDLDKCSMIALSPHASVEHTADNLRPVDISCNSSSSDCEITDQVDSMNQPSGKKLEWLAVKKPQVHSSRTNSRADQNLTPVQLKQPSVPTEPVASQQLRHSPTTSKSSTSQHDGFTLTSRAPVFRPAPSLQLSGLSVSSDAEPSQPALQGCTPTAEQSQSIQLSKQVEMQAEEQLSKTPSSAVLAVHRESLDSHTEPTESPQIDELSLEALMGVKGAAQ